MSEQPNDDHTLNACLARVIGKEVFEFVKGKAWYYLVNGDKEEWSPLQDACQMEEVEAWVIEQKLDIWSHYEQQSNLWFYAIDYFEDGIHKNMDGGKFWIADPDKKRAFALAIYQMEQSQKEK